MLPPLRVCVVAVVCLWLALGQVDGLLRQVQSADRAAGGVESLASGWPDAGMVQRTQDLAAVWQAESTEGLAGASFVTYTALDVAFIVAYGVLFLGLARRLRPRAQRVARGRLKSFAAESPGRAIAALAVLDLIEDALRLKIVLPSDAPSDALIWVSWGVTTLKWCAAMAVLALLGALVHERRDELAALGRRLAGALWRLRVLALPSLAFGALLLADPTQQSPDLLRRWLDGSDAGAALASVGPGSQRLQEPEDRRPVRCERLENAHQVTTSAA